MTSRTNDFTYSTFLSIHLEMHELIKVLATNYLGNWIMYILLLHYLLLH